MLAEHEKDKIRDAIAYALTQTQALRLLGTNDVAQAQIRARCAHNILDASKCCRENEGFVEAYMLIIEALKCAAGYTTNKNSF